MRYKKGDKVRVKSLDWYNANKNPEDAIIFEGFNIFDESMSEFCGKVVTIEHCNTKHNYYDIEEDGKVNYWTDEMFEGLAIEEPQEKMVSLDKVCKWLRANIDLYADTRRSLFSNYQEVYLTDTFETEFRKAMEK